MEYSFKSIDCPTDEQWNTVLKVLPALQMNNGISFKSIDCPTDEQWNIVLKVLTALQMNNGI